MRRLRIVSYKASYKEGCPNVVIEALNSGRRVVGSHVGGIPDLVRSDSGILVPPRNAEALAQALANVWNTTWDCNAIAQSNQRSWNDVAKEVMALGRIAIGEVKKS